MALVILTGFYNAEEYIERCLYTIKNQDYKDFTCYITHDLSTDNSVAIVKEFIKGDSRFILVDDSDKKIYQAGNFDKVIRNNLLKLMETIIYLIHKSLVESTLYTLIKMSG